MANVFLDEAGIADLGKWRASSVAYLAEKPKETAAQGGWPGFSQEKSPSLGEGRP